ncbi:MAG: hypothetical protein IJ828_07590 [Treponema sp.]|nr:hypothetical protein [Treponema sp.]
MSKVSIRFFLTTAKSVRFCMRKNNWVKHGKLKLDTESTKMIFFAKEMDVLNDIAASINKKNG